MSDHSVSIVPKQSIYPNKEFKTKEILRWLVSLDIVKPTLSDCVLSLDNGYAISKAAKLVSTEPEYLPFDLATNGLEIHSRATSFPYRSKWDCRTYLPKLQSRHCKRKLGFLKRVE